MAYEKDDNRETGFINFKYNRQDGVWKVGGSYTDDKGNEKDLGYAITGAQNIEQAIALIGRQIGPTLAGKGLARRERGSR